LLQPPHVSPIGARRDRRPPRLVAIVVLMGAVLVGAVLVGAVRVGAVLPGLALAAGDQACPPSPMDEGRAASIDAATVGPDGETVTFEGPDGEVLFVTTLQAWRAWAAGDPVRLDENPVRLGDAAELGPDTFFRFGVALATPDGCEAVLSAMSYAIATDVAFPVRARMDGTFLRYGPVTFGVIEDPAWSPDGEHLAFAVGTARASGEALEVRSHPSGSRVAQIDAAALADAWRRAGGPTTGQDLATVFVPRIRSLAWLDEGRRLGFVTDRPGGPPGTVAWTLDRRDGSLRPSGGTP